MKKLILTILSSLLLSTVAFAGEDTYYPAKVNPTCYYDVQFKCPNAYQIVDATVTLDADEAVEIIGGGDPHAAWCFSGDPRAMNCVKVDFSSGSATAYLPLTTTQGHFRVYCKDVACPAAFSFTIECPLTADPNTKHDNAVCQ